MKRTVTERLVLAYEANNLSMEADVRHDVDVLAAAGMAAQRRPLALALNRAHLSRSPADLISARAATMAVARRLAARRGWSLPKEDLVQVVDMAIAHHVFPACPVCNGQRFERIAGTPTLSARPCRACRGTGRRPIRGRLKERVATLLAVLEGIESATEWAVNQVLR